MEWVDARTNRRLPPCPGRRSGVDAEGISGGGIVDVPATAFGLIPACGVLM